MIYDLKFCCQGGIIVIFELIMQTFSYPLFVSNKRTLNFSKEISKASVSDEIILKINPLSIEI